MLHHVIPGSFEIASLQDEMTGVSLAGTQLRVNQYNMHDAEWNDVKVLLRLSAILLNRPIYSNITILTIYSIPDYYNKWRHDRTR